MKKFRALTASILASAMAMSMATGFAAFAAEGDPVDGETPAAGAETPAAEQEDNTEQTPTDAVTPKYVITIENIKGDAANHTYEAYQIFAGDKVGDEFDVTGWGDGIDVTKLSFAGMTDFTGITVDNTAASAKAVANVLNEKKYKNDDANMQLFAKAVGKALSGVKTTSSAGNKGLTDIGVANGGYYLIKDTNNSPSEEHSAKTRYMLTVADKLKATAKADYPTITKQIKENDKGVDKFGSENTAAFGDVVTYQLDSKVPDMTGYNKYFYIVNDSLFEGLDFVTYTEEDNKPGLIGAPKIEVKIGDVSLTQVENADEVATKADEGVTATFYVNKKTQSTIDKDKYNNIEIVFADFIQYNKLAEDNRDIVITYGATLNEEKAKVGNTGNPNIVDLTFSNNPNYTYEGTPDNPDEPDPKKPNEPGEPDGEPMGKTPPSKVITYTTAIKLIKIDASTKETLKGAEFTLTGEGVNTTLRATKTYVEDNENGTFYKLTTGEYTQTAPDGTNDALYETPITKYKETVKFENIDKPFEKQEKLAINDEGVLEIRGLNPGTYTLKETTPADGGYLLKDTPAVISITAEPSYSECKWGYTCSGVEDREDLTDGTLSFKFTNVKGVVLPGTGAFGTKLMYVLGTIFTATGAAYMISKKKSKKEEE